MVKPANGGTPSQDHSAFDRCWRVPDACRALFLKGIISVVRLPPHRLVRFAACLRMVSTKQVSFSEVWLGLRESYAAKDQLGHADEQMTQRYVRHSKGTLVTPTK